MQYLVLTYLVHDGRIGKRSYIYCADKAEADAMSNILDGEHNPGKTTITRRAITCVVGYSEAGKYIIPVAELRFCKSEVKSDE